MEDRDNISGPMISLLSVASGLIGVGLGAGPARLISGLSLGGSTITAVSQGDSVTLAIGSAVGIGLFFGIYPTYRAALPNPIDALHFE